ncbi:DUF2197 domain-containing protein [Bacillus massiliigorillae]|uniref:DUF2197 domain-containing protein n=1 Tax=Bacillus massiliigorillae TaxID=1243664 RepID=UPI0003A82500|nr:hypothetical protein [Bacillus massiliigorillae]
MGQYQKYYVEIQCTACKRIFNVEEDERGYQNFKENREFRYFCNECKEVIEKEALFNLIFKLRKEYL